MNKALIVEDDPNWLKIFHATVGRKTNDLFSFLHVSTLKEALAAIDSEHFNLIILDLMLPDSNASDTLKVITERIKDTPTIITTTLDDERLMQQAFVYGVEDFLVKDQLDGDTFIHACREAIKRSLAKAGRDLKDDVSKLIVSLRCLDERLQQWQATNQ